MGRELTGRTVFMITASAFAVIIGVNVLLAVQAVRTFPGLEVRSSYVASQVFDRERKAQEALGWTFVHAYRDGVLSLDIRDRAGNPAPVGTMAVRVGRPTEARDDVSPDMERMGSVFAAPVSLEPGRWVVFVDATATDGTPFRKRFDLSVRG